MTFSVFLVIKDLSYQESTIGTHIEPVVVADKTSNLNGATSELTLSGSY